jgi:hypothetical protein
VEPAASILRVEIGSRKFLSTRQAWHHISEDYNVRGLLLKVSTHIFMHTNKSINVLKYIHTDQQWSVNLLEVFAVQCKVVSVLK